MKGSNSRSRVALLTLATGALAAVLAVSAQAGAYYKWVDDKGVTHYGEKAPEGVNTATVKVGDTTSSDADTEIKRLNDKRTAEQEAKKQAAEEAAGKPVMPANERERINKLCEQHKQNLTNLKSGARLATKDEKGNKRPLSDQEKADQLKFAEGEVQRCADFQKTAKP